MMNLPRVLRSLSSFDDGTVSEGFLDRFVNVHWLVVFLFFSLYVRLMIVVHYCFDVFHVCPSVCSVLSFSHFHHFSQQL